MNDLSSAAPPRATTFRYAPITPADTAEWAALTNRLAVVDDTGEYYEPEDLAEELQDPLVDPERDTIAVRTPDGTFVAWGQLWHRTSLVQGSFVSNLTGGVDPDYRGLGIGTELHDRLERRIVEFAAQRRPRVPVVVRADPGAAVTTQRELLEQRGYTLARYFHEMQHDLAEPLPDADPVAGLRTYVAADSDGVREAHNAAFAQHWKSAPVTAEEWRARLTGGRAFRPEASFVLPGEGGIDGYVLCYRYREEELYVGILGVRDAARGRGVGKALLVAALHAARELGCTEVALGVDTDNVTGAGRLYRSLGFTVTRSSVSYLKTLSG